MHPFLHYLFFTSNHHLQLLDSRVHHRDEELIIELDHGFVPSDLAIRGKGKVNAEPQLIHVTPCNNIAERLEWLQIRRVHIEQIMESHSVSVDKTDHIESTDDELVETKHWKDSPHIIKT